MKQLPSLFISVFALIVSLFSIFAPPFVDKLRDALPDLKRSVPPGKHKIIYTSKLDKPRDLVIDITNVQNFNFPTLDTAQLKRQQQKLQQAMQERYERRSVLYIADADYNFVDSVRIDCFTNTTYELTVPPKGSLVLSCVQGCNTGFCSYEFLNLNRVGR